jgi:hypothetical protein
MLSTETVQKITERLAEKHCKLVAAYQFVQPADDDVKGHCQLLVMAQHRHGSLENPKTAVLLYSTWFYNATIDLLFRGHNGMTLAEANVDFANRIFCMQHQ